MNPAPRQPYDERTEVQLRQLVEKLVREGRSAGEIEAAVKRAARR